jgi:glycerophosphoryl diester phosphodiesterase
VQHAIQGYFAGSPPRLFGHRGAAAVLPENTLPSFRRAVQDGAAYLELDVHCTADDHIVVIHDATVDRTTDGTGPVSGFTLLELQRLDAGYHFRAADGTLPARGQGVAVPTLREVVERCDDRRLNIEVKPSDPAVAVRVVESIASWGIADRVLVASARDDVMAVLRPICRRYGIPTNFAAGEVAEFVGRVAEGRLADYRPPGTALQVPPEWHGIAVISEATVAAAHELDVEVHAWTINTAAEMEHLLGLGVDGIMTDLPALGRDTIAHHVQRQSR